MAQRPRIYPGPQPQVRPVFPRSSFQTTRFLVLSLICCSYGLAQYSAAQPGAVDPHQLPKQRMLFRDDQILATFLNAPLSTTEVLFQLYEADQGLDQLTGIGTVTGTTGSGNSLAKAGRFLSEANDQLAYLYSNQGGLVLQMWQRPPDSSAMPVFLKLLPNYAGPQAYGDAIAMAAGDLDNSVDQSGMRHDELVVAYRNTTAVTPAAPSTVAYGITLEVIDCSAWDGKTTTPAPVVTVSSQSETASMAPFPQGKSGATIPGATNYMSLSVATGDFDGDGKDEIALSYISNNATTVSLYRYTTDSSGKHALSRLSSNTIFNVVDLGFGVNLAYLYPDLSTATGDFDGKGKKDQLAIARVVGDGPAIDTRAVAPRLVTVSFDANYNPNVGTERNLLVNADGTVSNEFAVLSPTGSPLSQMKVELVSGLFKFAPTPGVAATDFNFGRSELVLAFNIGAGIVLHPFSAFQGTLSDLLSSTPAYLALSDLGYTNDFSIAAGGFSGLANAQVNNPRWSLAVSSMFQSKDLYKDQASYTSSLDLVKFGENCGLCETDNQILMNTTGTVAAATFPLVAYDYKGNSVYLGAPEQITTQGIPTTDFIIQEPPKHLYYDESAHTVVNVNRFDAFNSQLVDTTNKTMTITKQNTYSYGLGVSAASSASATVGGGLDIGIASASATVTSALNASANYDTNKTSSQLKTVYGTYNYTLTGTAYHDDYIALTTQKFDIWRYRIYGGTASSNGDSSSGTQNNFVEFVVPGPFQTDYVYGLNYDDYQPIQENGNLLSYPQPNVGGTYIPSDMGSFCVPSTDPNCDNPIYGPITEPASFQYGGGSTLFDLTFATNTTQNQNVTSSKNIKESADIKVTVKAKAGFLGSGGGVEASVDVGQNSAFSWTNASTAITTFSQTTELKGNTIPGSSGQSYAYYPVMYSAQDGTMKLAYGAKLNDSHNPAYRNYWNKLYGQKPDPALNLPWRFSASYSSPTTLSWVPETTLLRKQIRGFYLHKAIKNTVTGGYDYLSEAPTAGDHVLIEVQVHNYSLYTTPVTDLHVQFLLAQADTTNGINEVGFKSCPNNMVRFANGRCRITITSIAELGPQDMKSAWAELDTSGLGGTTAGSPQQYLVFVVLNLNNTVDEIYPLEAPDTTDYGQNNEGYGLLTVMSPSAAAAARPKLNTSTALDGTDATLSVSSPSARDLSMGTDSLGAIDTATGSLRFDEARVYAGRRLRIRVGNQTDQVSNEINRVLIYDGNPKAGGKLIAVKNVQPGDVGKPTYTWFDWTPMKPGEHTLYAEVMEHLNDTQPGNNIATLKVNVAAFPEKTKH